MNDNKGKRMNTLKKLYIFAALSTITLFAGFTTVDCNNQTHLDTLKLPKVECEVLDAFWDAMGNGSGWKDKTGWDTLQDVKDWKGIETFDEHPEYTPVNNSSILGILLDKNNLTGELPEALGDLIAPIQLSFTKNNIYGTVPTSIKNLTMLLSFSIDINSHLSGALPDFSQMPNLESVRIDENAFTFSDIEPQINLFSSLSDTFSDAPQANIDESNHEVVYFNENRPLNITPTLAPNTSGHDQYTWRHAPNATATETSLDYNKSRVYTKLHPVREDEGYYSYWVKNTEVSYIGAYNESYKKLTLYSTKNDKAIHVVYNNPPTISNLPDSFMETEAETEYSYTPQATDTDEDALTFSIATKPSWAEFNVNDGNLSGTPTSDDVGKYDINITVTDKKEPVTINYVLNVLPKDVEPQQPVAPVNRTYTHKLTDNTIATALIPELNSYYSVDDQRLYFRENNQCSGTKKAAYIGLQWTGSLFTAYQNCADGTFTTTLAESTPYPNGSKATLLPEPNKNRAMIMVEIPLTSSIIIGN